MKEALKLALELKNSASAYWTEKEILIIEKLIDSLEQPAQKPVAWGMEGKDGFIFDVICPAEHEREEGGYTVPLYTTPPKREWVGLTDEEHITLHDKFVDTDCYGLLIDAVEAKLKEKNK